MDDNFQKCAPPHFQENSLDIELSEIILYMYDNL